MSLKGIKSIHQINHITPDIDKHLISEKFLVAKKSHVPSYANVKGEVKYYKDLGGDDSIKHLVFISGSEIVVEMHYLDNASGSEVFKESFENEEEFVESYNNFLEWLKKELK